MNKKIIKYSILAALIMLNSICGINAQLSEEAKISIITGSPGHELYSTFGHTAIRILDSENDFDIVFSYGTFDFNTPFFYWKFARGSLNYKLTMETYESFYADYKRDQRSLIEQELNISLAEKNTIFNALFTNAKPENREYKYHFFFDNCATRVRDMVAENITCTLHYPEHEYIGVMTFRTAIAKYLVEKPWTKFGLDLILGQPTDDLVDEKTVQFLPEYLKEQFSKAKRVEGGFYMVSNSNSLLTVEKHFNRAIKVNPLVVLIIICVIVLLISRYDFRKKKCSFWVDFILFVSVGLLGLLIVFLWFFTSHTVTGPNWNILWANPLLILFLFFKSYNKFYTYMFILIITCLVVCLCFFATFNQYIPPILAPVWVMLIVRVFLRFSEVRHIHVKFKRVRK